MKCNTEYFVLRPKRIWKSHSTRENTKRRKNLLCIFRNNSKRYVVCSLIRIRRIFCATAVKFLLNIKQQEKNASIILSESSNYSSGANTPMSMSRMSSISDNPWIQVRHDFPHSCLRIFFLAVFLTFGYDFRRTCLARASCRSAA